MLHASGQHVYCTSMRMTTQKYKWKPTHSLRRWGYGVGPTQKYKLGLSPLNQGLPILILEGQCPAVFSSILSFHTCLEVSYNPGDLGYFSLGVYIWGWSQTLQDSDLLGAGLDTPALKEEFTQKLWRHLRTFMPLQYCMTESSAERGNFAQRRYFEECLIWSGFECHYNECQCSLLLWTKYCMDKSGWNFLQNILICVPQRKISHTVL